MSEAATLAPDFLSSLTDSDLDALRDAIYDPVSFRRIIFKRKSHPAQDKILQCNAKIKTISCGRRFGKAMDLKTPILTTEGWKTIGTLVVGDRVFGDDGQPTTVTYLSEIYFDRDCYKVTFSDGSSLIADSNHDWVTETKAFRKNSARWTKNSIPQKTPAPQKVTTKKIRDTLWYPRNDGKKEANHAIPVCKPLKFPHKDLLIDPYVLGAWLGDGCQYNNRMSSRDQEIYDEFVRRGYITKFTKEIEPWILTPEVYGPRKYHCNNANHVAREGKHKGLQIPLRKLGLIKNKHIPQEYLLADLDQRLDLLYGLMDTNGTISKSGHCEFTTVTKALADGVYQLLVSLGLKGTIKEADAKLYGRITSKRYRICFTSPFCPFKLSHKAARHQKAHKSDINRRFIVAVDPVPSVPVRCINVDNESHLFLAGRSLIATHNTLLFSDDLAHYALLNPGTIQFLLAPTYDQAEISWAEAVGRIDNSIFAELKTVSHRNPFPILKFSNGSIINFRSVKNPENIRGHKAHRVVLDEAAFIPDSVVENIVEPMLADYDGDLVKISTPFGKNHFHKTYELGVKEMKRNLTYPGGILPYASFHFTSYDNPHISHAYLDRKKATLGEGSLVWRTEYLAEFVEEINAVFPWDVIQSCIDVNLQLLEKGEPYHNYIIAADIAKHVDFTVITIIDLTDGYMLPVVYWERFKERKYATIIEHLLELQRKFNGAPMIVDSTGVGDAVYEALEEYNCWGYIFTNKSKRQLVERLQLCMQPKKPEELPNLASDYSIFDDNDIMGGDILDPDDDFSDNKQRVRIGQIKYPYIKTLIQELQYFEYKINMDTMNIKFRAKNGEHDDAVFSLALAAYAATNVEDGAANMQFEDDIDLLG